MPASFMRRLRTFSRVAALAWVAAGGASHADDAAIGREIFQQNCAVCHGKNMVVAGTLAFDLRTFPLTEPDRFRQSVLNGTPKGMPPWKAQLSADDIDALWDYVKGRGRD